MIRSKNSKWDVYRENIRNAYVIKWSTILYLINLVFFKFLIKEIDFTYLWNITRSTCGTPWGFVILENKIRRWKKTYSNFYLRKSCTLFVIVNAQSFSSGIFHSGWKRNTQWKNAQQLSHYNVHVTYISKSWQKACKKTTLAPNCFFFPLLLLGFITVFWLKSWCTTIASRATWCSCKNRNVVWQIIKST